MFGVVTPSEATGEFIVSLDVFDTVEMEVSGVFGCLCLIFDLGETPIGGILGILSSVN